MSCFLCFAAASQEMADYDEVIDGLEVGAALVDYIVVDQDLVDLFAMIERDTGLRIQASEAVRGRVEGEILRGRALAELERLAVSNNLDIFVFGDTAYVSAMSESVLRLVQLGNLSLDEAMAELSSSGLHIAQEQIGLTNGGRALTLSGPPRLVAIAEAVIENAASADVSSDRGHIRVRRGSTVTLEPLSVIRPGRLEGFGGSG